MLLTFGYLSGVGAFCKPFSSQQPWRMFGKKSRLRSKHGPKPKAKPAMVAFTIWPDGWLRTLWNQRKSYRAKVPAPAQWHYSTRPVLGSIFAHVWKNPNKDGQKSSSSSSTRSGISFCQSSKTLLATPAGSATYVVQGVVAGKAVAT